MRRDEEMRNVLAIRERIFRACQDEKREDVLDALVGVVGFTLNSQSEIDYFHDMVSMLAVNETHVGLH